MSDFIPANTAVVLLGEAGKTFSFEPTLEDIPSVGENHLYGTDEDTEIWGDGEDVVNYTLSIKNGKVGFYWAAPNGATFTNKAHRAFLATYHGGGILQNNFLSLFDETTGIENATTTTVDNNAPAYNLSGQRVDNSYKGVVIVNGKKMVRK